MCVYANAYAHTYACAVLVLMLMLMLMILILVLVLTPSEFVVPCYILTLSLQIQCVFYPTDSFDKPTELTPDYNRTHY